MTNYTKKQIAEWKRARKKWVKALRSGKYEQTQSYLYYDGAFCCLGVLCEVAGLERDEYDAYAGKRMSAPREAMRFVGLSHDEGRFGESYLSCENDNGVSFTRIAEIIEEEPEGLFLESTE